MSEPQTTLSINLITSKKDRIRLELWAKESENSETIRRFITAVKILIASASLQNSIDYVSGDYDYMLINGGLREDIKVDSYFDGHLKSKENERLSNAYKNKPNYLIYSYPISTSVNSNFCYIISTSASAADLRRKFSVSRLNLLGKVTGDERFKLLDFVQQQKQQERDESDTNRQTTRYEEFQVRNPLQIVDIEIVENAFEPTLVNEIDNFVKEKIPAPSKSDQSKNSKIKKRKQIVLNFDEPEEENFDDDNETSIGIVFKEKKDTGIKKFKMKSAFDLLPKKERNTSKTSNKSGEATQENHEEAENAYLVPQEEIIEEKLLEKSKTNEDKETSESESRMLENLNKFSQMLSHLPQKPVEKNSFSHTIPSKSSSTVLGDSDEEEGIDGLSEEEDDVEFLNHKLISNE